MGFPPGMVLNTIAFGIPLTATGKDVVTTVSVKPTARVIWAATGQPLPEFTDSFTAEAGQLGSFQVPATDQPGFIDSAGNSVTDFAYQITASWQYGNERPIPWSKNLKPLMAQSGTIDLDLVPDGPVSIPVTAPTAAVLGFGGRTGFITLQESDLPDRLSVGELSATILDNVEAVAEDPAGPIATGYASPGDPTAGAGMQKAAATIVRTVVATGHSLIYGQDTTASGTNPGINGAPQTRSSSTPTGTFATQAGYTAVGALVTLVNQGYPGDRSREALSRWVAGVSGDLELIWADTNDAMNYGGFGTGVITDAETSRNLRDLIKRARGRGSEVVVIGGAPVTVVQDSRKIFASAEANRVVAERMGARYIDAGELLAGLPLAKSTWTDGVHLSPEAYALVGGRLAGLLGPKGNKPPVAHPGRIFTPRQKLFVRGTVTTRADATSGETLAVTSGTTIALSVEVAQPVVPIIKLLVGASGVGAGVVGIYTNAALSGHPNRFAKIDTGATASGVVYVRHADALPRAGFHRAPGRVGNGRGGLH